MSTNFVRSVLNLVDRVFSFLITKDKKYRREKNRLEMILPFTISRIITKTKITRERLLFKSVKNKPLGFLMLT